MLSLSMAKTDSSDYSIDYYFKKTIEFPLGAAIIQTNSQFLLWSLNFFPLFQAE